MLRRKYRLQRKESGIWKNVSTHYFEWLAVRSLINKNNSLKEFRLLKNNRPISYFSFRKHGIFKLTDGNIALVKKC